MAYLLRGRLMMILIIIIFAGDLYAQKGSQNSIALTGETALAGVEINNSTAKKTSANTASVLSNYPKTSKVFLKFYPEGTDQQWTESGHLLFVTFLNSGRKTRACFTREGVMNYAITESYVAQLPVSLQQHIKSRYAGYDVYNAVEINAYNQLAYQVILENSTGYISLKSTSEGIEESGRMDKL